MTDPAEDPLVDLQDNPEDPLVNLQENPEDPSLDKLQSFVSSRMILVAVISLLLILVLIGFLLTGLGLLLGSSLSFSHKYVSSSCTPSLSLIPSSPSSTTSTPTRSPTFSGTQTASTTPSSTQSTTTTRSPTSSSTQTSTTTSSRTSTRTPSPSESMSPRVFFALADIHYDRLYSANAPPSDLCRDDLGPDNMARTCQDDDDIEYDESFNYLFGMYGCDTPLTTLYTMIEAMRSAESSPDFILILGDTVAHCCYSADHIIQTMREVFGLLREYFPSVPIYFVLGNNDVIPHNHLPVGSSELLDRIADELESFKLMPTEAVDEFRKAGFYSVEPYPELRLLALNTLYYYKKWCPVNNPSASSCSGDFSFVDDPADQFAWLIEELDQCVANNQSAYIFSHVGPNCSRGLNTLWMQQYADRFFDILANYSNTIRGVFFAHVHRDSFALVLQNTTTQLPFSMSSSSETIGDDVINLNTLLIHSSISPVSLENPSFRKVYANPESSIIEDYEQFYFSLDDVVRHHSILPQWRKEYGFREQYQKSNLSPENMLELYKEMQTNSTLLEIFKNLRITQSPVAKDYPKKTDSMILCASSNLCNYLDECMEAAGA